jgi:hypothetical protein
MGTIGWLIWCNVMLASAFAGFLSRLPMLISDRTATAQILAAKARLDAHVTLTATILQQHATKIDTVTTQASSTASAVSPIVSAGNASFLAGLSRVGGVATWPTFGGSPTLAELTSDVQNGVTSVNELLASMVSNGFI